MKELKKIFNTIQYWINNANDELEERKGKDTNKFADWLAWNGAQYTVNSEIVRILTPINDFIKEVESKEEEQEAVRCITLKLDEVCYKLQNDIIDSVKNQYNSTSLMANAVKVFSLEAKSECLEYVKGVLDELKGY